MMLKLFLIVYLFLYFAVAFFWRSYLVWKRTGVNPYALGKGDSAHDFIGKLFRVVIVSTILVVILYAFSEASYLYLTPILWLQHPLVVLGGIGLLGISLAWIAIAQAHMGSSWRIGIDTNHQTELIKTGLYRLSRNPIFLGMRLNLLGLFLVLPNAATLTIFLLGDILIQIQVRLEETYLSQVHGTQYEVYRQQTRRWL